MKKALMLTLLISVFQCWAQEDVTSKKDIRRTIGITSSILSNLHSPGKTSFSYIQRSLVYRQCWKSYIFSSQLSIMKQQNSPIMLIDSYDYIYYTDTSVVYKNSISQMNGFKVGAALHKGWTNNKINIYLGIGISGSKRYGEARIYKQNHVASIDSVSNQIVFKSGRSSNFSNKGQYLTVDLNLFATIEFLLLTNVTATLSFNPEFSSYFLQNTKGESSYFKGKGTYLQHNGIQLGLHYRIK
jgi:hypothetical protein